MAGILREIASLADDAVFSSKKDHFVPIGGFVATNLADVAERLRELVVVYEGFPHYGGMAGHDMEALAQGIREAADEEIVRSYVEQSRYLGERLQEAGVPIVVPIGAHAVFVDAKRLLAHLPQEQFPAQALAAAIYVAGGVRTMERGIVSGQHGHDPYHGLELVRLTLPRRVYSRDHLDYVVDVLARVVEHAADIPGLDLVYEPESLRFFQARFEPLSPFPTFGLSESPAVGSSTSGRPGGPPQARRVELFVRCSRPARRRSARRRGTATRAAGSGRGRGRARTGRRRRARSLRAAHAS